MSTFLGVSLNLIQAVLHSFSTQFKPYNINMGLVMRKPSFCICKKQRHRSALVFCYRCIITQVNIMKNSNQIWSEILMTSFFYQEAHMIYKPSMSMNIFPILLLSITACSSSILLIIYEPRHEKTNILVSDLVRHKPGCTATEDG